MLKKEMEVPDGVEVRFENDTLFVKGAKGELSRVFKYPHIKLNVEGKNITVASDMEMRRVNAIVGTWNVLIENMLLGVTRGWNAELKLVYSHFPVKLKVEDGKLMIENFLGERKAREVKIPEGLEVKVDQSSVVIYGIDKGRVGQLAASIEQTTKVKGYDKRVFQDGCYITKKPYTEEEPDE